MARKNPSEARVLVIGDAHDSPALPDKSRFRWIAKYASTNDIPYIRSVGDWATFDSCSQYESRATISGRDKPSFEDDMQSLEASILAFRSAFKKGYRPNCGITLGNHENRVKQWEDDNPEVEGSTTVSSSCGAKPVSRSTNTGSGVISRGSALPMSRSTSWAGPMVASFLTGRLQRMQSTHASGATHTRDAARSVFPRSAITSALICWMSVAPCRTAMSKGMRSIQPPAGRMGFTTFT